MADQRRAATILVSLLASAAALTLASGPGRVAGHQQAPAHQQLQLNSTGADQLNSHHDRLLYNKRRQRGGESAGPNDREPASLSSSMLRAFIRTNDMRAYHLDLHSYRPEARLAGDPAFVDSDSPEHQRRCRRHLAHFHQLLLSFKQTDPMEMTSSMESMRLADTYGRPGAGLLDGHQFWLGSYERCLEFSSLKHVADEGRPSQPINGQYCLALAQFPSWNPQDSKTSIKIGMCLPDTCTSSMLNERADLFKRAQEMMRLQLGEGLPFDKLRLRSVYCLPHETSPIRQYTSSSKLLISLVSLIVVSCIYATISDYLAGKRTPARAPTIKLVVPQVVRNEEQDEASAASDDDSGRSSDANSTRSEPQVQQQQEAETVPPPAQLQHPKLVGGNGGGDERTWRKILVESFSLIRNFQKLTSSQPERPVSAQGAPQGPASEHFQRGLFFNVIAGIKCVGLLWIIAAHSFLVGPIPHKNLIHLDQLTKTWLANVYLTAHLMVDSFFCLSGLLASYLIFRNGIHKLKPAHWVTMTVHRYWRLTPVYLICYWFAKSLGHLNNSGPLWDYMTAEQSPRLDCANESWLEAILHLSDFKSPKSHCVPFAWFIANGIKFWIITPLFLLAVYKSVRRGYSLICASIVANMALVFLLALNSDADMKSVIEFKPEMADTMLSNMDNLYTRPYSRIGAYLVGLLAGHWIYAQEAQQKAFSMSDKSKALAWSLFTATVVLLTFVIKIAGSLQVDESAIVWVFSSCSAIIRPLWALCTCWLVYALAHGQAKWLASFLCARGWSLIARLSFSAYLVQGEVIANLFLAVADSNPYTYADMVGRPLIASAATLAAALLMALFVEYPLIGIEELILPAKHIKSEAGTIQTVKVIHEEDASKQRDTTRPLTASNEDGTSASTSSNKLKDL